MGACSKEARGDEEDIIQEIRVWVGFLDRRMESELKFQPDLGLGLHFGSARGEFLVPFGPALVEVANEHFGFVTAESGGPGAPQAPTTVEGRLSQLERMIEGVNANLSSLIGAPSVMAPRPKVRSSQEKNAQARKADRGGGVAGLNPTTVAAALEAGVPMAHLEEMGKILQSKPPRLEDVPRKPTLKKKAGPLEESAEEEEESEGAELIPDDAGGADQKGVIPPQSIEQALLQLTTIATKLTKADQKKDKLDLILEGSGSAAGSEQSGVPGTRRNAAAVRALQKMLREDPKYLYEHIETNLQADFNGRAPAPGEPWTPGTTVRGWLMSRSRIQNYQNHVRWCWALGGIWDALISKRPEEARARCGLLMAAADQTSIDGGNWIMSAVSLLEPVPPYQAFSTHSAPAPGEPQHSALYDVRWAEIFLNHLKEMDSFVDAKKKLGGKGAGRSEKDKEEEQASYRKKKADKEKARREKNGATPEGGS